MNMLRIPKVLPAPVTRQTPGNTSGAYRGSRKRRDTTQGARLELTLEAPSLRPVLEEKVDEPASEPERGIAEIDFFI